MLQSRTIKLQTLPLPRGEDAPAKQVVERYRKAVNVLLYAMVFAACLTPPSAEFFSRTGRWMQLAGYICVAVAIVGRLWCGIYVFGRKTKQLCTAGPYSLCRHPLYVFSFVGGMGVAAQSGRWTVLLAFALIFWAWYGRVIRVEDRRLRERFGAEYARYRAAVPAILPRLRSYDAPASLTVPIREFTPLMWKGIWPMLAVAAADLLVILRT